MVDVVRCDAPKPGQAAPMAKPTRTRMECPWCGPYYRQQSDTLGVCPKCKLDAGEVRYVERIMADSTAVWIEETRAFNAQRRPSQSKGGP